MEKNTSCMIGIFVSAAIVICGILTVAGVFGGRTELAGSAPIYYDSGYASFGGDFYTYVSNNAAEAAQASRTVAKNLDRIAKLLKNVLGIALIGMGLLCGCYFSMKRQALAEQGKAEVIKSDFIKPDIAKPDSIKPDVIKVNAIKQDDIKPDETRSDYIKSDEINPEPPKEERVVVSDELPPL